MNRPLAVAGEAPCKDKNRLGKPMGSRHGLHDKNTGRDIVRVARSIGFSPEELLELRRLYQATPQVRSKMSLIEKKSAQNGGLS